ncbi:MAG: hypothetical protein AAGJ35_13355, partial [Myxococcota bacterium]
FLKDEIENPKAHTILLIVDMSRSSSVENINFVRMFVDSLIDQPNDDGSSKLFVLLLHYPPSGLVRPPYPVRFLGGWDHHFLDNIGISEESEQVERMIKSSCLRNERIVSHMDTGIDELVRFLMSSVQQIVGQLAERSVLYPSQLSDEGRGHNIPPLRSILNRNLQHRTVAEVMCDKFARMWITDGVPKTATRASTSILQKNTQLPLSAAVQSSFVESFRNFLVMQVKGLNQWLNADLLLDTTLPPCFEELFEKILVGLPVVPFEELLLYQGTNDVLRGLPFPGDSPSARFPFFCFVSDLLDKVVDTAEAVLVSKKAVEVESSGLGGWEDLKGIDANDMLSHSESILFGREDATNNDDQVGEETGNKAPIPDRPTLVLLQDIVAFVDEAAAAADST